MAASLGRILRILPVLALAGACAGRERPPTAPPAAASPSPSATSTAAVQHDLRVTLLPEKRAVLVEDQVTLSPELRARLGDRIVFTLHAGLSPERAGSAAPLTRSPNGPALHPDPDTGGPSPVPVEHFAVTLAPGERTFTIRYSGEVFHPTEDGGPEYARKMGESPGLVSPEGALLSGATRWVPEVSDDLVAFTLDVRVPPGWDAISQGRRVSHERGAGGTRVRWNSPEPQQEVYLVAGAWAEHEREAGPVALHVLLRADDPALAERYLAAGARYLEMYDHLIGPYPYPKFAVVENFWETGLGMPSFTLLGPQVLRLPFIVDTSYPHEVLHDWWGNGVYVDPRRGNWCEGLTAYLADHLLAEQAGRGADYRRTALQRYADYVGESRDRAVREFRARHDPQTQAIGYDKVLMVFHMARERMGDARFVAALRAFYREQKFREASFTDVARAMGAAAGEDLSPFFAQWIDRPGAPALRVESAKVVTRHGGRDVELALAQVQAGEPYAIDVPVYLTLPSSPQVVRRTIRMTEPRQRFTIPVDEAPVRLDIDPEFDVFRRVDPAELPPALSGALGAARRVLVLPSSAPAPLLAAYRALAESWKEPGVEIVADVDLPRVPPGKAVWVLGWENRLRPAVTAALAPHGAVLGAQALRQGERVFARSDRAVVAVARSPADPAHVIAFVGADRAAALPGLARKLPHYGKYGLLAFEGDEPTNVAKETWTALASPMAVGLVPGAALPARAPFPARIALVPPPPRAE
ncbi:M1 family metallopeptidase [Anaeromyxobacter oryzae]|uniref:Peptidase M1 n=1 Tax=Anaeromyxobacter oryzae TaxID=2918170 RepID=A0ABM7WPY0_9BACT|nr:M1 family aminopeptidase [Anaeromyxobacter oryzae]BDG01520.1 peptidase M1 [Anaeromyxobacter oryzae]